MQKLIICRTQHYAQFQYSVSWEIDCDSIIPQDISDIYMYLTSYN